MSGREIVIAPSILAADFARLGDHVAAATAGGVGLLHVDVMDGRFVPNISIGLPVLASLDAVTDVALDVHLMIVEPERHVEAFRAAGADMISVHVEAVPHLHRVLAMIRESGARAGVAVNPGTPVDFLPWVVEKLDYVLLMSVNPGWGGQRFIAATLDKVAAARGLLDACGGAGVSIEVDGGIGADNIAAVVAAGAEILVCGSSVFGQPDPAAAVRRLAELAKGAA